MGISIGNYEFFLLPLYIFIIFLFVRLIAKKYYPKDPIVKYLYIGLLAKIAGSIVFTLMCMYVFEPGDSFMYYSSGIDFKKSIVEKFPDNLNLVFMPAEKFDEYYRANYDTVTNFGYLSSTANLFTAKAVAFFAFLCFNSYLIISLFFSLIAFSGTWRLFVLFSKLFPTLTRPASVCFLFLPSLIFWSGGISKDSICLGAIGWFFTSFYYYYFAKRKKAIHLLIIVISFYLLYILKVYIALSMLLILGSWVILKTIASIQNENIRRLTIASIILISGIVIIATFSTLTQLINENFLLSLSNFIKETKSSYELSSSDGALLMNINDVSPSLLSVIKNVPSAINNALFRPYLWEARSFSILVSGFENFIIMGFTIYVIAKRGIFKVIRTIFNSEVIAVCFFFSILFAAFIGLTCFNFGTMVRYKLPCISFFCIMLVLVYNNAKENTI